MKSLEPPFTHFLNASQGWLLLGNSAEAEAELDRLGPNERAHPEVLEQRYAIHALRREWTRCFELAQNVLAQVPEESFGWIHSAYAARRMPGGGVDAAFEALLPAAKMCPREPIVFFNLACYACQLGKADDALEWLREAVKLGNRAKLLEMAKSDSDLAPLRERLTEL